MTIYMLLLLSLLSNAVVAHSVKLDFKNLHPMTWLPAALRDVQRIKQDRIRYGEVANSSLAPFQVLIKMNDGKGCCGGVILDESWVITAAHCQTHELEITIPSIYEVWAGVLNLEKENGNEQHRKVDMVIVHQSWEEDGSSSDIGLLHLESPFIFNDNVSDIALAEEMPQPGDTVITSGFGKNEDGDYETRLKWIEQDVPSMEDCKAYYGEYDFHGIDETMICTGSMPMIYMALQGDSGGPLHQIIDGTPYLVGLVSFGIPGLYDISTRVTAFKDWIENNMEREYETLVATNNDKQWSWSSALQNYNSNYVKLGCNTDACRVQIKALKIEFSSDSDTANFRVLLFEGWGLSEDNVYKDPMVTVDKETNIATIPTLAGYVAEGDKMTIVILLGAKSSNESFAIKFTYAAYSDSLCEDPTTKCDQVNDCVDLSDEMGCEYEETDREDMLEFAAGCYPDDFKCAEDSYCIRKYKICDGQNDCPNRVYGNKHEDEKNDLCSAACYIIAPFRVILGACILILISGQ